MFHCVLCDQDFTSIEGGVEVSTGPRRYEVGYLWKNGKASVFHSFVIEPETSEPEPEEATQD